MPIAAYLNPVAGCRRPLLAVRVGTIREKTLKELVAAGTDEIEEILEQKILVLVRHTSDVVHDITSVMLD